MSNFRKKKNHPFKNAKHGSWKGSTPSTLNSLSSQRQCSAQGHLPDRLGSQRNCKPHFHSVGYAGEAPLSELYWETRT